MGPTVATDVNFCFADSVTVVAACLENYSVGQATSAAGAAAVAAARLVHCFAVQVADSVACLFH